MSQIVIENPIINSPFGEPKRHFRFADDGITNDVIGERHIISSFIPVAEPKKKGKQPVLDTEWTAECIKPNDEINRIRVGITLWRQGGYRIRRTDDVKVIVEINSLDVYDPTAGEIRSNTTNDIACWFIDTDYNEESFFVCHAYFTENRLFDTPAKGKIAVKVINRYGDEVLKVYPISHNGGTPTID